MVDRQALLIEDGDEDFKRKMADILNIDIICGGRRTTLDVAIRDYVRSVIAALNEGDSSHVIFPEVELNEL